MTFLRSLSSPLLAIRFRAARRARKFQPQVGQAGKDVIWVPTPDDVVERMLTMAQVDAERLRVGPRRRRRQDRDHGGEEVRRARHRHRVQPRHGEARQRQRAEAPASPAPARARRPSATATSSPPTSATATVITLYLLPALNMKLRPTDPVDAPRHARGVALLQHGGLGSRRDLHAWTAAAPTSGWCRPT